MVACVNATMTNNVFIIFYRVKSRSNEERLCTCLIEDSGSLREFHGAEPLRCSIDFGFHAFSGVFFAVFVNAQLETFKSDENFHEKVIDLSR